MPRRCAYCGSPKDLTREHIWPKGFIKRLPTYFARYNPRANKVLSSESLVYDVCRTCNNGPLSALDGYACSLFDRYFHKFHEQGSSVDFEYDWTRLGRWLLKVAYNSARSSGVDADVFARHAANIIGNDTRLPDLAIWVDLIEPCYYEDQTSGGIALAVKAQPEMARICRIELLHATIENYLVRMVAINSFCLYMAIPKQPYSGVHEDFAPILEFLSLITCLDPDEDAAIVKTTGISTDHIIRPHIQEHYDQYAEFHRRHTAGD